MNKPSIFDLTSIPMLGIPEHGLDESVLAEIQRKIPSATGDLTHMKLDLGSLDSVREFARELREKFDRIHILVNNAGASVPPKKGMKTVEGFEYNFGVNHPGHFLLVSLVLDMLKKAVPSRIMIVSSRISDKGKLDYHNLMLEKTVQQATAYSNSKYANLLYLTNSFLIDCKKPTLTSMRSVLDG